jgi:hypothetical protein
MRNEKYHIIEARMPKRAGFVTTGPIPKEGAKSSMNWGEKLSWVGLCLVLISLGMAIINVWPVLVAHLTTSDLIVTAVTYASVLLSLSGLYLTVAKGKPARADVRVVIVFMILSWSMSLSLMGKIGGH